MSSIKANLLFSSVLLLLFFFTQSCTTPQKVGQENIEDISSSEQQHTATLDSSYQIKIGDEIEISVWEESNFNTTTTVSSMGTIVVPLIGEVKAVDKTQNQLKRDLTQRLRKYIKNEINLTVAIRSTESMLVSVFGMVTRPDNYSVVEETSIFKIISRAGGTTEEANIKNVRIYRENSNPQYTTLDLTNMLENEDIKSAVKVYPGDVVYVPQKENAVREVSGFLRDVVILFGIFRIVN